MVSQPLELSDEVSSLLADRASTASEGTLLLLPVRVDVNGVGQYREAHLTIPKELRHLNVPAEFLQDRDQRTGLSEYAADQVIAFGLGVVQNMTWDAAKTIVSYLFARARHYATEEMPQIEVGVARVSRSDGTVIEGITVKGLTDNTTAAELFRALTGDDPPSPPAG
jgi:hypothetical protein